MANPTIVKELLTALAVAIATVALLALEVAATVELPVRDLILRSLPTRPAAATAVVTIDEPSLRQFGPWPWPRARLAQLVDLAADANARAVVFDVLLSDPREGDEALARAMRRLNTASVSVLVERGEWLVPSPLIASATTVAHGNFELDHDGILRRFASTKQNGTRAYTALSLVAASFVRDISIPVGQTVAPAFRTPPRAIPLISAGDLLRDPRSAAALHGKIVFIGPTALGLGDRVLTPVSSRLSPDPGVTVHAAAVESLLRDETIRTLPPIAGGTLAFLAVFITLHLRRFRRSSRLASATLLIIVTLILGRQLLASGTALPVVTLLAAIIVCAAAVEAAVMTSSLRRGRVATTRLASGLGIAAPQSDDVGPNLEIIATRLAEERAHEVESKRVLAHELRTPLASMRGLTQLLGEFDLTEAERRRVTLLLQAEAGKLEEMVQALLDLERLPLRDFPSNSSVINLGDLVAQRIDFLGTSAGRQLTLMTDNDVQVRADAMLIERVIDNLVTNAVRYTPRESEIAISVRRLGRKTAIEVSDHGPGIPDGEHERIFQRFARASTAAGTEGLGLGLALVSEVARWHGGNVAVANIEGGGARFTVTLPAVN